MSGLDTRRLVLIHSTVKTDGGEEYLYGTGYFVTRSLVLTARHVVFSGEPAKEIRVRPEVPLEGQKPRWVRAEREPVWENEELDAALIHVSTPIPEEVPPVVWGDAGFQENQAWESEAYPEAASEKTPRGVEFSTSGLEGTVGKGGGGQGKPQVELNVDYAAKSWGGTSGAPVFVGEEIVGVITESKRGFEGRRLYAAPAKLLLRDPGFRLAIAPKLIYPPSDKTWVLILNQEDENPELTRKVKAAIRGQGKAVEGITSRQLDEEPQVVSVTDALEEPGRLFEFVQAVCTAPIMVFDVTDFEPGVMMFLGIRAAVRRGVTLTTTARTVDANLLSQLPFNIQESKLIYLQPKEGIGWIHNSIVSGLTQLKNHPNYLDLPAYNAVRCPEPKDLADQPTTADETALMLCSFNKNYNDHWEYVSNNIATEIAPKQLVRMLDIQSPRLTGLALYESIRWTQCCIVDMTHWRANVFFELGVRLACSDIGPVYLIEEGWEAREAKQPSCPMCRKEVRQAGVAAKLPTLKQLKCPVCDEEVAQAEEARKSPALKQRRQLITLLAPTKYELDGSDEPFGEAFRRYNAIVAKQDVPVDASAIAHNAIYHTVAKSYYWQQELISRPPHEELIANVQAQLGQDQSEGRSPVLFSSNPEFSKELERSRQERWIAAWYYLKGRYPMDEFRSDEKKRKDLITVSGEALQWLPKTTDYERIRGEIEATLNDLKGVRAQQIEDPLEMIRYLKTTAKNDRDRGEYKTAARTLEQQAIPLIQQELSSMGLAGWRAKLPSELSDCFGIVGGIYRRRGLESETVEEQRLHLSKSVDAYEDGYQIEKNPEYGIANSYNLVNRLVSYILLKPDALSGVASPAEADQTDVNYDVNRELREAESVIREQLKEKRRGDIWALADLALVRLLLDQDDPATAYAEFNAESPPDYAYESTLSTLRPMAELDLPVADKLREAVRLLEAKLGQLQSSTVS